MLGVLYLTCLFPELRSNSLAKPYAHHGLIWPLEQSALYTEQSYVSFPQSASIVATKSFGMGQLSQLLFQHQPFQQFLGFV